MIAAHRATGIVTILGQKINQKLNSHPWVGCITFYVIISNLMATSVEQLQSWLTEAQAAYHDLQLGKAAVRLRDQSGEEVQYNQANRSALLGYITSLQLQLRDAQNGTTSVDGPLRMSF